MNKEKAITTDGVVGIDISDIHNDLYVKIPVLSNTGIKYIEMEGSEPIETKNGTVYEYTVTITHGKEPATDLITEEEYSSPENWIETQMAPTKKHGDFKFTLTGQYGLISVIKEVHPNVKIDKIETDGKLHTILRGIKLKDQWGGGNGKRS